MYISCSIEHYMNRIYTKQAGSETKILSTGREPAINCFHTGNEPIIRLGVESSKAISVVAAPSSRSRDDGSKLSLSCHYKSVFRLKGVSRAWQTQ